MRVAGRSYEGIATLFRVLSLVNYWYRMRKRSCMKLLWLVTFALLAAGCAMAQSAPTTSLSGTVADPTGAVIPAAALELINSGTHWSRKTASDAQGRFLFSLAP